MKVDISATTEEIAQLAELNAKANPESELMASQVIEVAIKRILMGLPKVREAEKGYTLDPTRDWHMHIDVKLEKS